MEARGALYYPYIHPRDPNWVKATLLAFGSLHRLVPTGFRLKDELEIAQLAKGKEGRRFVINILTDRPDVRGAQLELLEELANSDLETLRERFGLSATRKQYRTGDRFQIHYDKILHELHQWLEAHDLCWPTRIDLDGRWVGVNPDLGSALMSVMSVSAARHDGLSVVTERGDLHHALAARDATRIVRDLVAPKPRRSSRSTSSSRAHQLAHIVMTAHVDVTKLSAADVMGLISDGHDLRSFREGLRSMVDDIPADVAPEVRTTILSERAAALVVEWVKTRSTWPRRLRNALLPASATQAEAFFGKANDGVVAAVTAGGASALASGATYSSVLLGAGVGFGVGLVYQTAKTAMTRPDPVDRYLSRIRSSGGVLVASASA
jgi:hypothetical protein